MNIRREEQKDMTRRKILKSAADVFGNYGFTQSTTSYIAKKAGVSHGCLFSHFKTKEILIDIIIKQFGNSFKYSLYNELDFDTPIKQFLQRFIMCISSYEKIYRKMLYEKSMNEAINMELAELNYCGSLHFCKKIELEFPDIVISKYSFFYNFWIGLINQYVLNSDYYINSPYDSVLDQYSDSLVQNYFDLISSYVKMEE